MNCKTEFANHEARIRLLEEQIKKLSTSPAQPAEEESQLTVKGVYIVCN